MTVSHTSAIITMVVGMLAILGTVGAFGISLLRRWWALEEFIKASMKQDEKFKRSDRKLKKNLALLVESKLSDHREFDHRILRMERKINAIRKGQGWGELDRQKQGYRPGGRHARTP